MINQVYLHQRLHLQMPGCDPSIYTLVVRSPLLCVNGLAKIRGKVIVQEQRAAFRFDVGFGRGPRTLCDHPLDKTSQAENLTGMEAEPAMIEHQLGSGQQAMLAQEQTGKLSKDQAL